MRNLLKVVSGVGAFAVSGVASAQAIDTDAITSGISDMEAALITVGGALVAVAAVAVAFKWLKGMVFS